MAKHAKATRVDVDVLMIGGELIMTVHDNGVGLAEQVHLSGLANLAARATLRGGSCCAVAGSTFGTTVTWKAPLS